eukprot:comp21074_c1_seq1/m.44396 comp21074_c1_seq1/g.44396  ORF comp21074_c1_seq1/g.44396 comp21074_c1_seq1/m.44396 type:complete len:145 (+) comp21074_c1_seq1:673-1107(+)
MRSSVSTDNEEYNVFVHHPLDGPVVLAICDREYPSRVAFTLLSKVLNEFLEHNRNWRTIPEKTGNFPDFQNIITQYQNPREADALMKVQNDLDETKVVMLRTIDAMLDRGQKLENLVDKSNDLSSQSKIFYKTAKKTNSCCIIS